MSIESITEVTERSTTPTSLFIRTHPDLRKRFRHAQIESGTKSNGDFLELLLDEHETRLREAVARQRHPLDRKIQL